MSFSKNTSKVTCVYCGEEAKPTQLFCRKCYSRLSWKMQHKLFLAFLGDEDGIDSTKFSLQAVDAIEELLTLDCPDKEV